MLTRLYQVEFYTDINQEAYINIQASATTDTNVMVIAYVIVMVKKANAIIPIPSYQQT